MPDYRLSNYPYVWVRLTCPLCPRRGKYNLAVLGMRYGAETDLAEVIYILSKDCGLQRPPSSRPPRKYQARCGARLADHPNGPAGPPPDLPPDAWREIWREIEARRK